ncbi:MAG: peptidoglycan DD-metalloendopeptidase family protein [Candidatus Magasanikbacteria bacterium]
MQYFIKKLFLLALRGLVYLKRALVWLVQKTVFYFEKAALKYRSSVGLLLYKVGFRMKKKIGPASVQKGGRIIDFIGKRNTLQVVLFLVAIVVMVPHSKLYTRDLERIPGRDTLLYRVVGPAQELDDIEEVTTDMASLQPEIGSAWRQRSVTAEIPNAPAGGQAQGPEEITAISTGGSAVTKPTILPGNEIPSSPTTPGAPSGSRTKVVTHTVQSGETIGLIAEKYDISQLTVLWANDLTSRSYIRPGDQLTILPVDGLVHTVKSGDTVHKIAKLYNAEADAIIKQNKLKNDGSDIVIGEELTVPGGEKPKPIISAPAPQPTRTYNQLSSVAAPPPSPAAPAGSGWLWPTSARIITQYYGWRHTGLDIAGPVGTPLYASKAGTVIKSQCGWNGGYGCYVILDHGGGFQSVYAHASVLRVSAGQSVAQGQVVADMGSTGRSTGSHIHFEIRAGGKRNNPLQYIR